VSAGLEAWREGRLVAAHRIWSAQVAARPTAWTAAYHLARLDGAFGQLTAERVDELRHAGLAEPAARRVDALAERTTGEHSLGALVDWDVDALRAQGADQPAPWWLERGHRAWQAGLFGLASVLVEEAGARDAGLEDDLPSWAHGIGAQIDALVAAVGGA